MARLLSYILYYDTARVADEHSETGIIYIHYINMKKALILFLFPLFAIGVRSTKVNSVSVLKGDSATLYTDVPDIERYDMIRWRFGQQESPVAEINRTAGIFNTYDGPDGIFRDRLQLDNQTGSLTIVKAETNHSGLYVVEISGKHTIHKSFSVTVGEVKPLLVIEEESVTLHNDTDEGDKEIMFKGIANISEGSFSAYGGPDGELEDSLNNDPRPTTRLFLSSGGIGGICAAAFVVVLLIGFTSYFGWWNMLLCW